MKFHDEERVLGQWFQFRPIWWTARLPRQWGSFLNELPGLERGYHKITRADVLQAAASGREERCLPSMLVAGYAWGTGASGFLVGRRARVFRDNSTKRIADCLGSAAELLHTAGPVAAYESLLRGGPNNLKYLGPSFFTKFLYAADASGTRPGKALILDRFVAAALKDIDGWDISRVGPWGANTYERWLQHAQNLASENRTVGGMPVRVDAVEMAYFEHGRDL